MNPARQQRQILRDTMAVYGRRLTITRALPGAYNSDTGQVGAGETIVVAGWGRVGAYRDSVIDGTLIQVGDRQVTWQPPFTAQSSNLADVFASHSDGSTFDDMSLYSQPNLSAFIPMITDTINIDGKVCAILNVKKRELEGDWISYTLQVR